MAEEAGSGAPPCLLLEVVVERGAQTVEVWPCDFASINQVKALAKRWLETERPLHYLFNKCVWLRSFRLC